jgi:hypothetical protein
MDFETEDQTEEEELEQILKDIDEGSRLGDFSETGEPPVYNGDQVQLYRASDGTPSFTADKRLLDQLLAENRLEFRTEQSSSNPKLQRRVYKLVEQVTDIVVAASLAGQTSPDGKLAAIKIRDHDGKTYRLVFPSSHLDVFAEIAVELNISLGITGALAERRASNELASVPSLHRIVGVVGIVEHPESETQDLELKTAQGLTVQLCFDSGQLQRLARQVLAIDEPEDLPGEH